MVRKHFLVSGRVQGVGFRKFVHKQALGLGIKGAVRNLNDGRVEILAQGAADVMAVFEEAIGRGPALAKVTSLHSRVLNEESAILDLDQMTGFEVYENGEAPWFVDS